ncbi:heterokaryon incompatibility protein-domain-containing protein [Xylaria cf. heliscus]|nr:heterokaryon incompatibility protein-domain-containing protein [Xylaria cf. heliscus]
MPSLFIFHTEEGDIPITASLDSALRRIRSSTASIFLWVDAICINQQNAIEKSIQIRQMGTIYQSAHRVLAWIGHEENNSHDAMETLHQVRRERGISPSQELPLRTDTDWNNVDALLSRSWFTRVWIVQELVLGSDVLVLCGGDEISWDDLFESIKECELQLNANLPDSKGIRILSNAGPAYALGFTRHLFKSGRSKTSFLDLLEAFSYTKSTKPCDKLFALLGLASDVDEEEFNPDYDSELGKVVRRYAETFVKKGRALDLLYRAGLSKSSTPSSWIPDWTADEFPHTISTWDAGTAGAFYAGRHAPPEASLHEGGDLPILKIEGVLIDSITSMHEIRMGSGAYVSFTNATDDIRKHTEFLRDYPTGESLERVMLLLPIGDANRPQSESPQERLASSQRHNTAPTDRSRSAWPDNLADEILSIDTSGDVTKYAERSYESKQIVSLYWQTAADFTKRLNRAAFCTTERRYAGLAPGKAQKGDKICLFRGGKVPFILRETSIVGQYRLVGECYIHGIMYGEMVEHLEGRLEESIYLV